MSVYELSEGKSGGGGLTIRKGSMVFPPSSELAPIRADDVIQCGLYLRGQRLRVSIHWLHKGADGGHNKLVIA